MEYIYLIDTQDKYCPENNNGSYIIEAWTSKEIAQYRVSKLEKENPGNTYPIIRLMVNVTEQEAMNILYPVEKK